MSLRISNLLFLSVLFLMPLSAQNKEKSNNSGEEKLLQEAKHISELVDMLDSSDVEIRNTAAKELASIGRAALPFVEQRLREKGNTQYVELIKSLYTLDSNIGKEDKWVSDAEIPKYDEVKKMLPQVPRDEVEHYVYVRYAEAVALYNKGGYDRALDIATAILKLEPNSIYKEHIRKLKQICDQKIQQGSLVKAQIFTDKEFYEFGEKAELTIRVENVYKDEIVIHYGDAATKNANGTVLLDIVLTYFDAFGNTTSTQHSETISVEPEIPIGVGANWEVRYAIDTSKDGEAKPNIIRTYLVNARTLPHKIDIAGKPTYRRIVFEPATVKVYPKGSSQIANKALASIGKAIDSGTFEDVFLSAMLLKADERDAGVAILMTALKKLEEAKEESDTQSADPVKRATAGDTPAHKVVYTSLKYLTNLPYGQDARAWLDWWENRPEPGKKKSKAK